MAVVSTGEPALTKRMRPLLGTFVELAVRAEPALAESAMASAFAVIQQLHAALSFQSPTSELSQLNRARGAPVKMSRSSRHVLRLAVAMARASGGRFNCTVGGALQQSGALPSENGAALLACGDADDILFTADGCVRLRRAVAVTLDGIAKGYAVDCAVRALRRQGVRAGWVNAGGDVRVFGDIVLPLTRREREGAHTVLAGLRDAAIASSQVGVPSDAAWPAQLIAPPGKQLAASGIITIMAASAWRADALTKVAALVPVAQRAQCVRSLGGEWLQ